MATVLNSDPKLLEAVIAKMSPEQRRRLTVAGGAYEWFGKDRVKSEVSAADADNDRVISPRDFNHWFENALKRHAEAEAAEPKGECKPVPFSALLLIALEAGLPFVGFGFLDNATMILAGDAIDKTVGLYFNCSVMACAALGNVVSGVCGMQVHGGVEKLVHALGLPVPVLSAEQQRSQRVFLAGHMGGTFGIAIGLTLGMLPLLFIREEEEHFERKAFQQFEVDGRIPEKQLPKAVLVAGTVAKADEVLKVAANYGQVVDGVRSFSLSDFVAICETLGKAKSSK